VKLSAHFDRSEFACACGCGFDTVDTELLDALEALRAHFERPVRITSGARCAKYNAEVGGSPNSQHLIGRAADVVVDHIEPELVHEYFRDHPGGLGSYSNFTHIDTRNERARWTG